MKKIGFDVASVVGRFKPSLAQIRVRSAFLFGSSLCSHCVEEMDMCIILEPERDFNRFVDVLGDVLVSVGRNLPDCSICPTMELSSFAVDPAKYRIHLIIYPDYNTYIRCESPSLRDNINARHVLLAGVPPLTRDYEPPTSDLYFSHWDILLKVSNSLILLLNRDTPFRERQVFHARIVFRYCVRWLFQTQAQEPAGDQLNDFLAAYQWIRGGDT